MIRTFHVTAFPLATVASLRRVVNDPNHAAVINQLQLNPLRFCPQQAKVPWTKLMHEQMIKESQVTALLLASQGCIH